MKYRKYKMVRTYVLKRYWNDLTLRLIPGMYTQVHRLRNIQLEPRGNNYFYKVKAVTSPSEWVSVKQYAMILHSMLNYAYTKTQMNNLIATFPGKRRIFSTLVNMEREIDKGQLLYQINK